MRRLVDKVSNLELVAAYISFLIGLLLLDSGDLELLVSALGKKTIISTQAI